MRTLNTLRSRAARRDEAGFTLIELLVVIAILGILAGIAVFSVAGITDRGTESACEANLAQAKVATETHYAKTGGYAASTAVLDQYFQGSFPSGVSYDPSTGEVSASC